MDRAKKDAATNMIDDGTDRVSGLFVKAKNSIFSGKAAVESRAQAEKEESDGEKAFVTLIVDGFNHPLTAGNFVDLCLRGFYDGLPVYEDVFEQDGSTAKRKIFGKVEGGYRDPLTGAQRRIPLEVLREGRDPKSTNTREDSRGKTGTGTQSGTRFTATGLARNSAVFTKAEPVLSFATVGVREKYALCVRMQECIDFASCSDLIFYSTTYFLYRRHL
jgi:peptidylprolyl isomerase